MQAAAEQSEDSTMGDELGHLDFIPEPQDPRILSAADPRLEGHQESYRSLVSGWHPDVPPQAPLSSRRMRDGRLPMALILVLAMALASWWGMGAWFDVGELQYPESEWAYEESRIRDLQQTHGLSGAGVHVCIVDTGIDTDHGDLAHLQVSFKDFITTSDQPLDHGIDYHGTMMSGILVASGHLNGVSKNVTLSVAAALGSEREGASIGETSLVADAIEWCWKERGADIISLSLGGMQDPNSTGGSVVEEAVTRALNKGVFVVAAAGNDGGDDDDGLVSSPSNVPLVISVGASGKGGKIWDSSSSDDSTTSPDGSPREDPNLKPEIIAPGAEIISTAPAGQYFRSSGTSGATVFISGTLALILEAHPEMSRSGGSSTNVCIVAMKQALMDSTDPSSLGVQHDALLGYGNLDAVAWFDTVERQQLSNPCG